MKKMLIFSLALNFIFLLAATAVVYRVGGIIPLVDKLKNIGKNKKQTIRSSLFSAMPSVHGKTVFLGNSLTEDCQWSEIFESADIVNRGIGGDVARGVYSRLPDILEQGPSKIFLMIGINDLLLSNSQEIIPMHEKIYELQQKFPGTKLYVQSILPVNNNISYSKGISNKQVEELNKEISSLCGKYKIDFIDLYPLFLDPSTGYLKDDLTTDGLHLTGKGYQLWKEAVKDKIKQ